MEIPPEMGRWEAISKCTMAWRETREPIFEDHLVSWGGWRDEKMGMDIHQLRERQLSVWVRAGALEAHRGLRELHCVLRRCLVVSSKLVGRKGRMTDRGGLRFPCMCRQWKYFDARECSIRANGVGMPFRCCNVFLIL